jgi:hypothetical protein
MEAGSSPQLRQFPHLGNVDKVFGTHRPTSDIGAGVIVFFILRLHLAPPAEAREHASRVSVLALARATCATTRKRWRPKPGELRQAAIELLPIQISHRQPAGEALP